MLIQTSSANFTIRKSSFCWQCTSKLAPQEARFRQDRASSAVRVAREFQMQFPGSPCRAVALGFFTRRVQAEMLIQASSANFSIRKSSFLLAVYEQIGAVRSQIPTGSGNFCSSDVKKIPNAISLEVPDPWITIACNGCELRESA